jgi:hypothetical protein
MPSYLLHTVRLKILAPYETSKTSVPGFKILLHSDFVPEFLPVE